MNYFFVCLCQKIKNRKKKALFMENVKLPPEAGILGTYGCGRAAGLLVMQNKIFH